MSLIFFLRASGALFHNEGPMEEGAFSLVLINFNSISISIANQFQVTISCLEKLIQKLHSITGALIRKIFENI